MQQKIVAVCGGPYVGKHSIVEQLGRLTNTRTPSIYHAAPNAPNVLLDIPWQSQLLRFIARSGVYLDPDTLIPTILTGAHLVVYVVEPCFQNGQSLNFTHDYYQKYFDYYATHAKNLGVFWTDIPWIIVVNKMDLASNLPPGISQFPIQAQQELIRSIATQGVGITELWHKIINTLTKPT